MSAPIQFRFPENHPRFVPGECRWIEDQHCGFLFLSCTQNSIPEMLNKCVTFDPIPGSALGIHNNCLLVAHRTGIYNLVDCLPPEPTNNVVYHVPIFKINVCLHFCKFWQVAPFKRNRMVKYFRKGRLTNKIWTCPCTHLYMSQYCYFLHNVHFLIGFLVDSFFEQVVHIVELLETYSTNFAEF